MLLGVLMCLVVWSTVSGINIKLKHLCPEDMFQVDQEARTPAGDHFITLSARRRRRISVPQLVATCEGVFTIQVSMQGDHLCVYPSTDDREGPAYLGQENTFLGPESDGLLYSFLTSPDSRWRAIQDICSAGGNEAPDIINSTLLKDTVTEVVEQWFEQASYSVVTLTCICSREEL
ncbi:HTH_Tnp_Tc3_2 domain-containing protein [Trichonephila clavipes]|nr:HTH_Tnp_Tc3_2 domain-containing protein [Trichonephila clavipes]